MTTKLNTFLTVATLATTLGAQSVGDWECGLAGTTTDPTCEDRTRDAGGVHTFHDTNNAPAVGSALPETLGSTAPVHPLPGASESNLTVVAATALLELDNVGAAFTAAFGGSSFYTIPNPASFLHQVLDVIQVAGSLPIAATGSGISLLVNLVTLDTTWPFPAGIEDAHELRIQ